MCLLRSKITECAVQQPLITHSIKLILARSPPKKAEREAPTEGAAYLPAAGAARLAQNIPKFLQVVADRSGHLQRRVETGPEPARGRMSSCAISEGSRDPDPARFSPSARVAAPSGPSREPPPTAVRHFNTLPACPQIRELGGRSPKPANSTNCQSLQAARLQYAGSGAAVNMDPDFRRGNAL